MDSHNEHRRKRHKPSHGRQEPVAHVRALLHDDGDDGHQASASSHASVLDEDEESKGFSPSRSTASAPHPPASLSSKHDMMLAQLREAPTDEMALNLADLQGVFAAFRRGWISPSGTRQDFAATTQAAAARFADTPVDSSGKTLSDLVFSSELETHHISVAYNKELFVWHQLLYAFMSHNLLEMGASSETLVDGATGGDDDLGLDTVCNSTFALASDFKQILESLIASRDLLLCHLRFLKTWNPTIDSAAPPTLDPFQAVPLDPSQKFSPSHELTLFVLRKLKEFGYRKFRGGCWQPILTEPLDTGETDKDGGPVLRCVPTHAWEPVMIHGKSMDIEQFIVSVVRKEDHTRLWTTMTTGGNLQNLVTFLREKSDELEFQTLKPNRDFISFKNGILDIRGREDEGPTFTAFPISSPLRIPHVVANNFITGHFGRRTGGDDKLCNGWPTLQTLFSCGEKFLPQDAWPSTHPKMYTTKETRDKAPDRIDWIQVMWTLNSDAYGSEWITETFNNIFTDQLKYGVKQNDGTTDEAHTLFWVQSFGELLKAQARRAPSMFPSGHIDTWPRDFLALRQDVELAHMIVWHYALLGRLLFRVNDKDSWQVIQMIKGVAGCGKSTILNLVGKFFRAEDVETLSNQTRGGGRAIGVLETVYDKFLWRVYEIKENFGLDQSAFQSMVSGEIVPIDRLNQKTISVAWSVPGILAGNEFGGWRDNSGSILRRVLVSNFAHIIDEKHKDPLMPSKLDKELPAILHKCLLAYSFLTSIYKGSDIWQVVPEYFRWTRSKLSAASDPLASFLASTPLFKREAACFVPLSVLIASFKDWATSEGVSRHQMQSVTSMDEDKLKPSLATQGLQFVRLTDSNREEIETGLKPQFTVPADWKKGKGFVVVRGLSKLDVDK